ncbi:MAG: anhydro-N-acetylmuramic acid kinase [Rhodospirillaceae bacterium]
MIENIKPPLMTVIGLMSGTSLDGIDAALIRTDGLERVVSGAFLTIPYDDELRGQLRSCLGGRGPVAAVEQDLTDAHAAAVRALLTHASLSTADIDLIGFHGHTILHAPHERRTWQIGDGARLAVLTGIAVVSDFRSADVAAGGQGAPLVPLYHRALVATLAAPPQWPVAILNIGGVANVTWLGPGGGLDVLAFDTGPGNALIDDWVLRHTGQRYDEGGALARLGRVCEAALAELLDHPYFGQPAPKSLDRNAFDPRPVAALSVVDGAATLTAFTAATVAAALSLMPSPPRRWLVGGGGRLNETLMTKLARRLGAPVVSVDSVGWSGDALEAQAFGYLAVRSRLGLPLSLPSTTGVPHPMSGGRLHSPQKA